MATMSSEGAARCALAALSGNGGFEVILRLPGPAVSGNDAEQLGLGTPQFQDVPIGPASWRKAGSDNDLLMAASPVAKLVGSSAVGAAQSLFENAVGVLVSDVLYRIEVCEAMLVAGEPCAYKLRLEAPIWA